MTDFGKCAWDGGTSRAIRTFNYSEEEFGYISPQNENRNICTPQSASFLDLLTSNLNRRCVPAYILNYSYGLS